MSTLCIMHRDIFNATFLTYRTPMKISCHRSRAVRYSYTPKIEVNLDIRNRILKYYLKGRPTMANNFDIILSLSITFSKIRRTNVTTLIKYANFYIAAAPNNDSFTSSKSSENTRFLTVNLTGRHNTSYKIRNTNVVTDIHVS